MLFISFNGYIFVLYGNRLSVGFGLTVVYAQRFT
ncbi:hypothetical protein SAMN05444682_102327 [Parapedobacter indicus]|uniref:Uncharacterized protein n=1 Tax=Parapedobacter indicus TaxID=1477437 RepID=A0A1I3FGT0_9SPHI|nr:hypothetical protein CLV26_102327 [Parapedobacter indicus]SFI10420.1 hypothetical protein SAMN05444682_102327 [Parapedobacter indicus]